MRPMLATSKPPTLEQLEDILCWRAMLATPKIDGIRCLVVNGKAMSRTLKPIRNEWISQHLSQPHFNGFDGEITVGELGAEGAFQSTTSAVMSVKGRPKFTYNVFDLHDRPKLTYAQRSLKLMAAGLMLKDFSEGQYLRFMLPKTVTSMQELCDYETECLNAGYEGVILRAPNKRYKYGRATLAEAGMLKVVMFETSEARIIDVTPWFENNNMSAANDLGYAQKSQSKHNLVATDKLGTFYLEDVKHGWIFNCGSGLNDAQRKQLWRVRDTLPGKIIKYKYKAIGMKNVPRAPIFLGFRHGDDM